ncbi:hypothetical protein Tco_0878724 [Tanacetum coccineum]|uniref:Uncharacterized protein n=1 Tax=Tanacetum coccineum TaxID=301880 RepID=A0ABQ5C0B3_9ASTR
MAPRAVLMKTGLKSFNTARPVNTVSTARETHSTAGRVVYGRRSKEARKDKGKAIMTEPEPEKKSKKLLEQRDWFKICELKNKPKSEAQARKNMIVYLKNQSNYKMKGLSYDEIRPIFEKAWDQHQSPVDELRAASNSRDLWDMLNVAINRDIQTDLSKGRQLMVAVRELQASINMRQTLIHDAKENLNDNKIATVLFFLELQDKDIAFVRDLLVKIDVVLKRPGEKEEFLRSVKRL